jgi:alpha-L-rhamnosidase
MKIRPERSPSIERAAPINQADAAAKLTRVRRAFVVVMGALAITTCIPFALAASSGGKPDHLTCDSLDYPLGIDSAQPLLSWQLQDAGFAARQTAYRIEVATTPPLLTAAKPDVWDSGRIASGKSFGVVYGGPELTAATRYYWRVELWDKDGKPYPASDVSWWETGLLKENWKAQWIGYEDAEHRAVRESGAKWITNADNSTDSADQGSGDTQHDFRFRFRLTGPVKHADLFVTGKDSAAAWVNGKQVLETVPLPPWKQAPWKTYLRQDVTSELRAGENLLAVGVTLYGTPAANGMGASETNRTPMSACLYVEMMDGSAMVWASNKEWKAALNAKQSWYEPEFDDSAWQSAIAYVPPPSPMSTEAMGNPWQTGPVKLLRHSFAISKPVTSARLYATALGAYRFQINGARVGDQILSPGWDDFRTHVPYQAYDVTQQLTTGQNAIAAWLAPGWYTTPLMWFRQGYNYGDTPPALKAQLRIAYADGSIEWIATDASWKADISPISQAEIYDGENYDARKEQAGWDTAAFSDAQWKPVDLVKPLEPEIVPQSFPPIRAQQTLTAGAITSPKPGTYIYDFHQNLAGVARLRARGPAGTDVQLRFAEVLNPDGTLYVDNLRTAKATDHYILSGKGLEEFQPDFTFHGFRYVEVTGLPDKPDLTTVQAVAIYTDASFNVQLHSGSPMINQLWSNILWGQRSNFVGVPTDCPQRDERLGWTADAQVFWRTASYNMDLTQFSKKFARDLRGTQVGTPMYGIFAPGTDRPNPGFGAGWSDAGVIIPWTAWLQSGDTRVLEQNWDAMEKYLSAIQAANPDYLWKKDYGIPFGDWLSPEGRTLEPLVATAYWAYDVTLMQQMAHALGKAEDEAKYASLFGKIKTAFASEYVHADGFIAGADNSPSPFGQINNPEAKSNGGDTQTSYVLALNMKLLPDSLRDTAANKLVAKIEANHWRLATGFLGTPYLLAVLVDTGHSDVAYRLLLNTEYPSWGYLVGHGATTMWERWNGDEMRGDPSMNSYNHYAYGAVADWIYRYAAGIDALPSDAGFHTIYLHPNFDARLGSLDFRYQSSYGEIRSAWSMKGKDVSWLVTVPPNTTAQMPLPASERDEFTLDGEALTRSKKVRLVSSTEGNSTYELPAGTYSFRISMQ